MLALTCAALFPQGIIGNVWAKSPPRTTGMPPNKYSVSQISQSVILIAAKFSLFYIGTLSQMIKDAQVKSEASWDCLVILQMPLRVHSRGILNQK